MKLFKTKRQTFIVILAAMAAFLVLNSSFFGLLHNIFELRKLTKTAAALDAEYKALGEAYKKIEGGDVEYIEDTARVKYHMSKPGEIEFRIQNESTHP